TLAKKADARVFAINYRLAPQNQFPAALQDALAAYMYLLSPPKDAGFEPLDPKNIFIAGTSAGGGLSIALGLALRDAGLPMCAGIIGWAPWVDLTHSSPSFLSNKYDNIDFVNILLTMPSIIHDKNNPRVTQVEIDYIEKAAALSEKIKKQNVKPKIWHDSFDRPEGRMQMYVPNEGLAIPYVSPMLAESLGDLPPLYLMAGGAERLLEEIIYFAHRSAEPTKYKGPSYNAGKFEKSPFHTPTNTTLEIYEEMPHVFQMFNSHACIEISYKHTAEFINRVLDSTNKPLPPSSFNRVNDKEEISPLNEHDKEVLKWEYFGIVPSFDLSAFKVPSRK
ncbi:494_t:CDS:2, partial [Funneliformis geosporum]